MIRRILNLFRVGTGTAEIVHNRARLFFDEGPDFIYAIGDVHGCYDLLQALEDKIYSDARALPGTKWLIMLGDYVDRGPKSASVIDKLIAKPSGAVQRFCLAGNHEDVMLDFLQNPSATHRWLEFGGLETLHSYGIYRVPANKSELKNLIHSHVPDDHLTFLAALPALISVPAFCFVHAGIENGVALADQDDMTLLWTRPNAEEQVQSENPFTVVHGHTPVRDVDQSSGRINIDTGAYMSGLLSAVRISRDGEIAIIQCS